MEHHQLDMNMAQLNINEKKRISTGVFKYKQQTEDAASCESNLEETKLEPRRSTRKKIHPIESTKRRVLSKPKKILSSSSSMDEISNYYLDKRIKRLPPALETIFEEPNGDRVMSIRKFKRSIQFSSNIAPTKDKAKIKKRSMKAKRLGVVKRLNKTVALQILTEKLSAIEDDDTEVFVK